MSKIEERELFFEHIKKIYMQNPNFKVTPDTIYNELKLFNVQDGKQMRISNDNLIKIQARLSNYFRKREPAICFSKGPFFAIENRNGYDDKTFYDKINTSIKLYIACDKKNLYNVTGLVFNYMIDENIITQSKIAKEMRNDVLVVRVSTMEEAEKVSKFVNSLDYNSSVSYNPYILSDGKVGMTYDGTLSYNKTLSLLMNSYFNTKKNSNSLDKSTMEDFVNFIKREVLLCINDSEYLHNNYYDIDYGKEGDFIKIADVIIGNLDGTLNKANLEGIQVKKGENIGGNSVFYENKEKLLYVIYRLSNYYDIDYVHRLLMDYCKNGNADIFTRRDLIRDIIVREFSPYELKLTIIDIGDKTLEECISLTKEKYDDDQCVFAISKLLLNKELDGFTRDNGVRNKLGLIVPKEWLGSVVISGLDENSKRMVDIIDNISLENKNIVMKNINRIQKEGLSNVIGEIDDLTKDIIELSKYIYEYYIERMRKEEEKKSGKKY